MCLGVINQVSGAPAAETKQLEPPPAEAVLPTSKKRDKSPSAADKAADIPGPGKKKKKNPEAKQRNKEDSGSKPSKKLGGEELEKQSSQAEKASAVKLDHAVGDIWWSNMLGKAMKQMVDGVDVSEAPHVKDGEVVVKFLDGTTWNVPHLVPQDLNKAALPGVPEKAPSAPKKPKAKAKAKSERPVTDFELPTVRCKYALQGKNPAIVKIEVREDRNNLASKFKQKAQIVIRESISATIAMNVAITFAECYEYMNLNPSVLNFRECRDALLGMGDVGHDWSQAKLDWRYVAGLCLKGFPPKCLGETIVNILA